MLTLVITAVSIIVVFLAFLALQYSQMKKKREVNDPVVFSKYQKIVKKTRMKINDLSDHLYEAKQLFQGKSEAQIKDLKIFKQYKQFSQFEPRLNGFVIELDQYEVVEEPHWIDLEKLAHLLKNIRKNISKIKKLNKNISKKLNG